MVLKKILRIILVVLIALILILGGYCCYVLLDYERIEDKVVLTPEIVGRGASASSEVALSDIGEPLDIEEQYKIMTYNIGFGAYTPDYSFFMDGGKSSWAESEEGLIANTDDIGDFIVSQDADFVMLQEVDTDGTRSYHVNQYERLKGIMGCGTYVFAENFHSSFLMWPLLEPHGANCSGIMTFAEAEVDNALRRSLPISSSLKKFVDLDRCYSITRIPTSNGKLLCLYNVHLSAYGAEAEVREGQLAMLFEDMNADYADGNYVIVGGDYNHNLRGADSGTAPEWAQPFPADRIPDGFRLAFDLCEDARIDHNSCRDANEPFQPGHTFTVMVDGFIISENITVKSYQNIDIGYLYSDHDPVVMEFELN